MLVYKSSLSALDPSTGAIVVREIDFIARKGTVAINDDYMKQLIGETYYRIFWYDCVTEYSSNLHEHHAPNCVNWELQLS